MDKILLERNGELTCPVRKLVVFAGTIDYRLLAGKTKEEVQQALREAAGAADAAYDLPPGADEDQVRELSELGELPPLSLHTRQVAGSVIQFARRETPAPPAAAVDWKLVLWARFNNVTEGREFYMQNKETLKRLGHDAPITIDPPKSTRPVEGETALHAFAQELGRRLAMASGSRTRRYLQARAREQAAAAAAAAEAEARATQRSHVLLNDVGLALAIAADMFQQGQESSGTDDSADEGAERVEQAPGGASEAGSEGSDGYSDEGASETGPDDSEDLGDSTTEEEEESDEEDLDSQGSLTDLEDVGELVGGHTMFRER